MFRQGEIRTRSFIKIYVRTHFRKSGEGISGSKKRENFASLLFEV